MADLARALSTPVPATQPAPQQQPTKTVLPGYDPAGEADAKREAKNERARLHRKNKRAADAKAREAAAKPKKKKRKAKKKVAAAPVPVKKKRGRGRPPGAKNKPKVGLAVALVPAAGVLPRDPKAVHGLLAQIGAAVSLLNAMPEHARKVVLDAVK